MGQEIGCATPGLSETVCSLSYHVATRQKPPWEEKWLRGSRERAPIHAKFEPKGSDGVAQQQPSSNSAIGLEARPAQPWLRASES